MSTVSSIITAVTKLNRMPMTEFKYRTVHKLYLLMHATKFSTTKKLVRPKIEEVLSANNANFREWQSVWWALSSE
jgi:hypothetical protein